ncbi:acyl carrier protein [Nocardia yamanashiensis]|uniref:acyl carrier protein n=1 Tax=Nocardia yamanashiensis TaxID=209247 RepID=UPI001E446202|nr:acyl carrier protein [Nocardia yamanashiensis]UGT42564.1 acyl carrier protein [Nocardia yamanashiensis]
MSLESSERGRAMSDAPAIHVSSDEIIDWMVDRIAEFLEVPASSIDIELPFIELGLSSVQAIEISGNLEQWLGLELPPTLAYDYPTIEDAAGYIADQLNRG